MAALEEPAIEREESSINKSSFDVETFCQRHLKCKECNKSYVDPIMLSCLHTYCPDCFIQKAAEKKRKREESAIARESQSVSTESYVVVQSQREGEERAGEEEGEDEEEGMVSEDENQEEGEREAGAQEDEERFVPHKKENLTAPHDCDSGDDVQGLVNRPLSNIIHAAKLKEKLPQGKMECQKCKKDIAKWICNNKECGNIPLCDFCREAHRRQEDTEDHQVNKIDPEKDWWKGMNRQTWPCSKHRS
ncbi:PREDICTED: uncharacterized protein LOC109583076 [Amphimedon queenslandica]|uniref:Uncharacterized protein n=1 Tax=Amphimedon queenslandica TaxID=400682 RepID=A0AAN0J9X4_AMPQE|nr:PREDICTED: uncharacterized protein LOC109583076 [Amphimedon queenslandica]|eukprot:XP_019853804.1 PREDICTED: uncharacterized protein LOC109583076 [Amphimedon queenslandica]